MDYENYEVEKQYGAHTGNIRTISSLHASYLIIFVEYLVAKVKSHEKIQEMVIEEEASMRCVALLDEISD